MKSVSTRVRKGFRKVKMCGHVRGEFPKHRTDEFKKTRRKYLVIISVSPARLDSLET